MPPPRKLPPETAIIEQYKRRASSVEEALIERFLAEVWLKRSWGGEVKNVAVLIAIGTRMDAQLDRHCHPSELCGRRWS